MISNGRHKFTRSEFNNIRELIRELRKSDRNTQKILRNKLRKKMGLYISDFQSGGGGFTEGDLLELVQTGQIQIVE